jgi:hypothetical protein
MRVLGGRLHLQCCRLVAPPSSCLGYPLELVLKLCTHSFRHLQTLPPSSRSSVHYRFCYRIFNVIIVMSQLDRPQLNLRSLHPPLTNCPHGRPRSGQRLDSAQGEELVEQILHLGFQEFPHCTRGCEDSVKRILEEVDHDFRRLGSDMLVRGLDHSTVLLLCQRSWEC